eukprot:98012_1
MYGQQPGSQNQFSMPSGKRQNQRSLNHNSRPLSDNTSTQNPFEDAFSGLASRSVRPQVPARPGRGARGGRGHTGSAARRIGASPTQAVNLGNVFQNPSPTSNSSNGLPAPTQSLNSGSQLPDPIQTMYSPRNHFQNQTEGRSSGETDLAQATSSVISLANRLSDLGAHCVIDLPTIVFCGKQSAGKSSLVEAISAVPLPRADGTCTRTPGELRLTETAVGSRWQCQVKLRWEHDDLHNRPLGAGEIRTENFESMIYEKGQVDSVVTRAQTALLNPSGRKMGQNELKFSRNVVCIDIQGPGVGNLSIIDLPGMIQAADKREDEKYIHLIRDMVMGYISKEDAIIAMVISCKDDMENQAMRTLARQVDPQGIRSIGILTKPDTVEEGTHQKYVDVLQGRAYQLKLGYFACKNPSQMQMKQRLSHSDARRMELEFFRTAPGWSQVTDTSRFGSTPLAAVLSQLLKERIQLQIPVMRDNIFDQQEALKKRLEEIGEVVPEEQSQAAILKLIYRLFEDVKQQVNVSDGADKGLYNEMYEEYGNFSDSLKDTSPKFALLKERGREESHKRSSSKSKDAPLVTQPKVSDSYGILVPVGTAGATEFSDMMKFMQCERGRRMQGHESFMPVQKAIKEFVGKWNAPVMEMVKTGRLIFEKFLLQD